MRTKSIDNYVRAFRGAGHKITPQRRLIFQILVEESGHLTAEEFYQRAQAAMPDISRSTVYSTLNTLVELGALAAVEDISTGATRYDSDPGSHHHLYCLACGKLVDIHPETEEPEMPCETINGFQIVKRQVTYYGYCPDCQDGNPQAMDADRVPMSTKPAVEATDR